MTASRSYSDQEIAHYVLSPDGAEQAENIEALLAHDDAAATRALKWEAHLLGIVDTLPPVQPPETLWASIQNTLGLDGDALATNSVPGERKARGVAGPTTPGWRTAWSARLRRLRRPSARLVIALAAIVAVVIIVGILVWASLRPIQTSMTHQTVNVELR